MESWALGCVRDVLLVTVSFIFSSLNTNDTVFHQIKEGTGFDNDNNNNDNDDNDIEEKSPCRFPSPRANLPVHIGSSCTVCVCSVSGTP